MQTIEPTNITDLAAVEEKLATLADSPLAAQLQALLGQLRRKGSSISYVSGEKPLTPNEAAKVLNVSRTIVMSMIRRGELVAVIVGERDHRISLSEVQDFIERRDRASKDLAASFARGASVDSEVIARAAGMSVDRAAELGF